MCELVVCRNSVRPDEQYLFTVASDLSDKQKRKKAKELLKAVDGSVLIQDQRLDAFGRTVFTYETKKKDHGCLKHCRTPIGQITGDFAVVDSWDELRKDIIEHWFHPKFRAPEGSVLLFFKGPQLMDHHKPALTLATVDNPILVLFNVPVLEVSWRHGVYLMYIQHGTKNKVIWEMLQVDESTPIERLYLVRTDGVDAAVPNDDSYFHWERGMRLKIKYNSGQKIDTGPTIDVNIVYRYRKLDEDKECPSDQMISSRFTSSVSCQKVDKEKRKTELRQVISRKLGLNSDSKKWNVNEGSLRADVYCGYLAITIDSQQLGKYYVPMPVSIDLLRSLLVERFPDRLKRPDFKIYIGSYELSASEYLDNYQVNVNSEVNIKVPSENLECLNTANYPVCFAENFALDASRLVLNESVDSILTLPNNEQYQLTIPSHYVECLTDSSDVEAIIRERFAIPKNVKIQLQTTEDSIFHMKAYFDDTGKENVEVNVVFRKSDFPPSIHNGHYAMLGGEGTFGLKLDGLLESTFGDLKNAALKEVEIDPKTCRFDWMLWERPLTNDHAKLRDIGIFNGAMIRANKWRHLSCDIRNCVCDLRFHSPRESIREIRRLVSALVGSDDVELLNGPDVLSDEQLVGDLTNFAAEVPVLVSDTHHEGHGFGPFIFCALPSLYLEGEFETRDAAIAYVQQKLNSNIRLEFRHFETVSVYKDVDSQLPPSSFVRVITPQVFNIEDIPRELMSRCTSKENMLFLLSRIYEVNQSWLHILYNGSEISDFRVFTPDMPEIDLTVQIWNEITVRFPPMYDAIIGQHEYVIRIMSPNWTIRNLCEAIEDQLGDLLPTDFRLARSRSDSISSEILVRDFLDIGLLYIPTARVTFKLSNDSEFSGTFDIYDDIKCSSLYRYCFLALIERHHPSACHFILECQGTKVERDAQLSALKSGVVQVRTPAQQTYDFSGCLDTIYQLAQGSTSIIQKFQLGSYQGSDFWARVYKDHQLASVEPQLPHLANLNHPLLRPFHLVPVGDDRCLIYEVTDLTSCSDNLTPTERSMIAYGVAHLIHALADSPLLLELTVDQIYFSRSTNMPILLACPSLSGEPHLRSFYRLLEQLIPAKDSPWLTQLLDRGLQDDTAYTTDDLKALLAQPEYLVPGTDISPFYDFISLLDIFSV